MINKESIMSISKKGCYYFQHFIQITKNQLSKIYLDKKHLIIKLIIIAVVCFIVCLASFLMRDSILNANRESWDLIPGFLAIKITENPGISFGNLGDKSPSLVFFVQSIPIVIGGVALIFSWNYLYDIGLSMLFFGGLCNVIDRSLPDVYTNLTDLSQSNAVVDYFQFSFIKNSAIFNFPDTFIICGVILICLQIIISWIKDFSKTSKSEENKKPVKQEVLDENKNKKIVYKTIDKNKIRR